DESLERRVAPRGLLPKEFSRSGKQDDRYLVRALCAFSVRFLSQDLLRAPWALRVKLSFQQSLGSFEQRLGLQHHSFAAAKRTVVHGAVAVTRESAQIVHRDFHQAGLARPAHNPVVERPLEKLRENGADVKAQ